ncbi:MAG: adenosylcobinamide-GDP ribazoletransferase, partial [Pseudomonadota bacterium]
LLTRLPVGRVQDPAPSLSDARWAFPLAGVPVGLIAWGAFAGAEALGLGSGGAAWLALLAAALVTGGLHHDGLADFADGVWGGQTPARRLEIMRDSRIGSYGVIALILVMALMAEAIALSAADVASFVALAVLSRVTMVGVLSALPPARADGLGDAAAGAAQWHVALAALFAACAAALLGWAGMAVVAGMLIAACAVAVLAKRALGGQTGDVLGATQMVSEAVGWCILVALI